MGKGELGMAGGGSTHLHVSMDIATARRVHYDDNHPPPRALSRTGGTCLATLPYVHIIAHRCVAWADASPPGSGFQSRRPPVVSGRRTDTCCNGNRNERRFGTPTLPPRTLRIDEARRRDGWGACESQRDGNGPVASDGVPRARNLGRRSVSTPTPCVNHVLPRQPIQMRGSIVHFGFYCPRRDALRCVPTCTVGIPNRPRRRADGR